MISCSVFFYLPFFLSQDGWGCGDRGGEGGIKNVYEKEEHIHDLRLRPSYGLGLFYPIPVHFCVFSSQILSKHYICNV